MKAEKLVSDVASDFMCDHGLDPIEGPCQVHIVCRWPIPVSWSKKRREAAIRNEEQPGKPDLDNVAKLILDAFNGVVYEDDKQVVTLTVTKVYSEEPGTWVFVHV